ncbi:helix-turn-helix transcriptional regulator [Microbulbifer bruguierae]|uniref:Helix-turn-helix transcriptional regulator n=1 Tax=Microbulbifer bruguierae TaxID=3029061 RepID=A0ABY8NGY9_9GAMM|nr:helix-turn-helix transcriptional regulator [Microbulbifer bruguierae]WGL18073.1 helix-turn-helix transcriptional regulator [Microbulbifer bruguierae]
MNYDFFTGASCSLLLLAAARVGLGNTHRQGGCWLLVLICGALCYLLQPLLSIQHPLVHFLFNLPVIFCPAAFWLFTHTLCGDHRPFPRWGWGFIATDFAVELAGQFNQHPLLYVIAQPFKLGLIGAALLTLVQQLQSDLVAERRLLRIALLIAVGGYMVVVVCAEFLFSFHQVPKGIPTLHMIMVSTLTFASCLWLLALSPRALEDSLPGVTEVAENNEENAAEPLDQAQCALLEKLKRHMETGGYRHTGLTIRELAQQLDTREHILRALINRHLGYRNFNEYLNQFRINEASRRLADPNEAHLPVLSIALDIGYRSLSPFNAAFKRHHNQTPTEFRREQLAV